MIVDRGSLAVRPLADRLLVDGGGAVVNSLPRGPVTWSNELVAHVLEFKVSAPVASLDGVAGAIHASAREANRLLEGHGARLLGGGMHPWFDPARETASSTIASAMIAGLSVMIASPSTEPPTLPAHAVL